MSYEKDIIHLKEELLKSKRLYSDAIAHELPTDIDIWSDDIENLEHQIAIHEKSEAFDEIARVVDENTGLGEGDEDLVNWESILNDLEIIIGNVESEAD